MATGRISLHSSSCKLQQGLRHKSLLKPNRVKHRGVSTRRQRAMGKHSRQALGTQLRSGRIRASELALGLTEACLWSVPKVSGGRHSRTGDYTQATDLAGARSEGQRD